MPSPSISNLRKRAKALGLVIVKLSSRSPYDNCAEYIIHEIGAAQRQIDRSPILSIWGIRGFVEARERRNIREA